MNCNTLTEELENLDNNPNLFRKVINILINKGIKIDYENLYVVTFKFPFYDNNPNSIIYKKRKEANDPEKIIDVEIPKVFKSREEALEFIENDDSYTDDYCGEFVGLIKYKYLKGEECEISPLFN